MFSSLSPLLTSLLTFLLSSPLLLPFTHIAAAAVINQGALHHSFYHANDSAAQPVTHTVPTSTPQTEQQCSDEDDSFKKDKSSQAAMLKNQPTPACGSAVRATTATMPSQHKTRCVKWSLLTDVD